MRRLKRKARALASPKQYQLNYNNPDNNNITHRQAKPAKRETQPKQKKESQIQNYANIQSLTQPTTHDQFKPRTTQLVLKHKTLIKSTLNNQLNNQLNYTPIYPYSK